MKKILTTSTKVVQAGFALKGIVDIVLHPLKSVRDIAKKILIKAIVLIVKKVINLTMKNKTNEDSHIVIKQLNALTDSNANMNGLTKRVQFTITLDSLLKEVEEVEEYKILFINLTKLQNTYANYKNSVRNDIYEYIIEEDFKNVGTLTNGVNEVLKMPTDIVGCEFAKCKFFVQNHDEVNKNFNISFDVEFAVKSTN